MKSQTLDYQISVMSLAEVSIALDWANAEGWNPGLNDAHTFYAADPSGFLIGKLDGQPIATISAVKYGLTFGFIGLYIVQKNYRHQGYGLQIWHHALDALKGRCVGLDGVLAQQDNYQKSGFQFAHRNIRFAGFSPPVSSLSNALVNLSSLPIADLYQYDRHFFPEQRDQFLPTWIDQPQGHALGIVENTKLLGYGVIRACHNGYKIGPLNAENQDWAIALFEGLVAKIPAGSEIYLDVPEPNAQAMAMAQRYGLQPSFETARMYLGEIPSMALEKMFGITTFELG